MTFMPMVRVLAGPVERPFRYLLTASILAPLAVLILAAMIDREHLIDAATMEARKTVDVLHEHSTWGKKPGRYDDERGCTCS